MIRGEIDALSRPSLSVQKPSSPMKKGASGRLNVDTQHFEQYQEPQGLIRMMSRGNSQTNSPSRSPSVRSISPSRSPSRRLNQEALISYEKRLLALETELEESRRAIDETQDDLRRRKESYMRREEILANEVEVLNEELRIMKGEGASEAPMAKGQSSETIKLLHGQITSELENLLAKQEVALNYNSSLTIRKYADKLNAYEAQIASDKELKGNSLAQWMERTAALRAENETTREIAMAIDARYKQKEEECSRLRNEFKAQEDDRAILLSQMVKLRTENKKLSMELVTHSQELEEVKEERDTLLRSRNEQAQSYNDPSLSDAGSEFKEALKVSSLRQQLEAERKKAREAQSALDLQAKKQTELHTVLQTCLEDCREKVLLGTRGKTVVNRPSSAMSGGARKPYSAIASTSRPFSAINIESRESFVDELVKREALLLQVLSSMSSQAGPSIAKEKKEDTRPASATIRPPLPSQFLRPRSAMAATTSLTNSSRAVQRDEDDFIIDEGDEEDELCVPNPSIQLMGSKPWALDASALHRDHLSSGGGARQTLKPKSAGGRLGSWGRPVSAVGKT